MIDWSMMLFCLVLVLGLLVLSWVYEIHKVLVKIHTVQCRILRTEKNIQTAVEKTAGIDRQKQEACDHEWMRTAPRDKFVTCCKCMTSKAG